MKLYHYFRSSASYRARIALNFKAIDWEAVPVDLREPASAQRTPEFLALNPHGSVPVLVDGDNTITQSLAVLEYLEEAYPQPPLLPHSPAERAQVRSLAFAIACDIHPLGNLRVLNYLRSALKADEDAVNAWVGQWIARGFGALELDVQRTSADGRHMFGAAVTLADVCIVPQVYGARRYHCDLTPFPTLRAICAHLEMLPAFAQAAPDAQAGARS
jgi:maleylacetoacetate isomerase